jgi:protein-S-isoprenylcysteine O-methyltransferase Ste14
VFAGLMAAANAILWVLASRWESPGRDAELRTRLQPPPLIDRGGDLMQVAPLIYPILVVVGPDWAYEGWLNWERTFDVAVQVVGLILWGGGVLAGLWASRVIRRYLAVSGLTVDHQLVTDGPYRYVRHPVYTSLMTIAIGTALVFRSYLLVAVAVASIAAHRWWASAEEELLRSPEGFGDTYRRYETSTGRFLPRLKRVSRAE